MDERGNRLGSIMASIGVVAMLILLFVFSWRVFFFYQQVKKGGADFSKLHYASTTARSESLKTLAAKAPGTGELMTPSDPTLGNAKAKVTVVEFADFGCPFSAEESYVVRALAREFPDTVRFVYRDFPLDDLHPGATLAALGGNCAQDQGKFWEFHDALFKYQGEFTKENLIGFAESVGINADTFGACLTNGKYTNAIQTDQADGVAAGVVGTPTFFVNGVKAEGAIPYAIFKEVLQAFLQN